MNADYASGISLYTSPALTQERAPNWPLVAGHLGERLAETWGDSGSGLPGGDGVGDHVPSDSKLMIGTFLSNGILDRTRCSRVFDVNLLWNSILD
jgi:hypothetical protein